MVSVALEHVDPIEEVAVVELALGAQVVQRQLHDRDALALAVEAALELPARAVEDVEVDVRDRAEAPALDQDGPLVERLGGVEDAAVGGEHRRLAETELDELQADDARIERVERGTRELDHVHLDALGGESPSSSERSSVAGASACS